MKASLVAALVAPLCVSFACRGEREPPEPTAPWAARPAATPSASSSAPLVYRVTPEARLAFRLPARAATPEGHISGVSGEITVTLDDLALSRGTVSFDLSTLALHADGPGDDPERTEEALSWLGLGSETSQEERTRLRTARFELDSLRDLSATRAARGKKTGDKTRRVDATAAGRLVLRELAVEHRVPLELDFEYSGAVSDGARPERVTARFRAPGRVPLAEHSIVPRDAAGRSLPAERSVLGQLVGNVAEVRGELPLALVTPPE